MRIINNMIKSCGRTLSRRVTAMSAVLCAALLALPSCFDDKGTNPKDYITLDVIGIDTVGMNLQRSYSVIQGEDHIRIAPRIMYNGRDVTDSYGNLPLDFAWIIYTNTTTAGANYAVDTLSTAPSIDAAIDRGAGGYILLFSVTDRLTGVQSYCSFTVDVSTDFTSGLLVLYENADGNTDVGMIINSWTMKNSIADKTIFDVYSMINGAALRGKPIGMYSTKSLNSAETLIASEKEYVAANRESFLPDYTANELFYEVPDDLNIQFVGDMGPYASSNKEYIFYNNQRISTAASAISRAQSARLGNAVVGQYGELALWSAAVRGATFEMVLYDQTSQCFRYIASNGVEVLPFGAQPAGAPFDISDMGMRMVASDWGYSGGSTTTYYEYSLMRNGGENALIIANWGSSSPSSNDIALAKFDVSASPGIGDATMVVAGRRGPVFYYATDSGVYVCNADANSPTVPAGKLEWSAPAGEKITCMKSQKYHFNSLNAALIPKEGETLYIATWNETAQTGTVYMIPMDYTSGALTTGSARIYPGFGKIKDMCWKMAMIM